MANTSPNTWSGVGFDVHSALAAAKTLTAISKASPAVCQSVAHGLLAGDWVVLSVSGMRQLHNTVKRVSAVTADSFTLEGEDATLYDTFSAGTARKVTAWASAGTFTDISTSGGEANKTPSTTIHADNETNLKTTKTAVSMAVTSQWILSDPALQEMNKADRTGSTRAILARFKTGDKVAALVDVSCPLVPTGSAQQIVTTPISLEVQGALSYYSDTVA